MGPKGREAVLLRPRDYSCRSPKSRPKPLTEPGKGHSPGRCSDLLCLPSILLGRLSRGERSSKRPCAKNRRRECAPSHNKGDRHESQGEVRRVGHRPRGHRARRRGLLQEARRGRHEPRDGRSPRGTHAREGREVQGRVRRRLQGRPRRPLGARRGLREDLRRHRGSRHGLHELRRVPSRRSTSRPTRSASTSTSSHSCAFSTTTCRNSPPRTAAPSSTSRQ